MDHLIDRARRELQKETVTRLNELSNEMMGWRVDAGPIDVTTSDSCGNDWNHGRGVVQTSEYQLCPGCAAEYCAAAAQPNTTISLDVLL